MCLHQRQITLVVEWDCRLMVEVEGGFVEPSGVESGWLSAAYIYVGNDEWCPFSSFEKKKMRMEREMRIFFG